MQHSVRRLSLLAFAMFALMWLLAIAQSPGGMSALGHEIAAVEQQLLQPPPHHSHVDDGSTPNFEVYPGGVVCEATTSAEGEPEATDCRAPVAIFPY